MIERMRELQNTLTVMESIRPHIDNLINAITYVLIKKNKDGVPEVSDFIKDTVILEKMTPVESERLVKRFIKRCEDVGQKKKPMEVKEYFINTIGEFVLIAMGIIGQEMFTLKRGQVDEEIYTELKKDFKKSGINLDELTKPYKQGKSGGFFWNRWKTLDKKPTALTDDRIRAFITRTVRRDQKDLLKNIDYENMISKIREINSGHYDNPEDKRDEFRQLFADTFSGTEFNTELISLLRQKWYKELEVFYQ